jgi:hypothetical protein
MNQDGWYMWHITGRRALVGKVMGVVLFGRHRRGWEEILLKWTFSKQYEGFELD